MKIRQSFSVLAAASLLAVQLQAQASSQGNPDAASNPTPNQWDVSVTADRYAVPHSEFHLSPVIGAERGLLHLEGVYFGRRLI
jgi:hypothetical protein